MIINVQYKNKKTGEYGGRRYSYFCDLSVEKGDLVKVPVRDTEETALVAETNVPEGEVDERILKVMKSVIAVLEPPSQEEQG